MTGGAPADAAAGPGGGQNSGWSTQLRHIADLLDELAKTEAPPT